MFCNIKIVNTQPLTWEKLYSHDVANAITRVNDSIFYLCGNRNNTSIVLKINQYGDTLWKRQLSDSTINYATSITTTEDKGCVLAGLDNRSFAAKYDINGNLLWKKSTNPVQG